jgi:hypothetical protein
VSENTTAENPVSAPRLAICWSAVAALMLISGCFCIWQLFGESIRLDEAQSAWQTHPSKSFAEIIRFTAGNVHVPLYHITLHQWQLWFGTSVEALRALSLIFYLATIPAVFALGSLVFSRQTGLLAAALVASSGFFHWYGSEARMYSLLALLTVLNQLFFFRFLRRNHWADWAGYALTGGLGTLTHYCFGLSLLAQVWFWFDNRKNIAKTTFWKLALVAVLLISLLASWTAFVRHVGKFGHMVPRHSVPTTVDLFNTFSHFLFGYQPDSLNALILAAWPVVAILLFMGVGDRSDRGRYARFFLLVAVIPLLVVFTASHIRKPFFLSRYFFFAAPAFLLFLSSALSTFSKTVTRLLCALVFSIVLFCAWSQSSNPQTKVKERYREAVEYITRESLPGDKLIVSAPFTIFPFEYYYKGNLPVGALPPLGNDGASFTFRRTTIRSEIARTVEGFDRVWLIQSYDQGYETDLRYLFNNLYENLAVQEISAGLTVQLYKISRGPAKGNNNPFAVQPLFVNSDSPAAWQAELWHGIRPKEAALLKRVAQQPLAKWLVANSANVTNAVAATFKAAQAQKQYPVFVAYHIPDRDAGGHSGGGARNQEAYLEWIQNLALTISTNRAALILEPDALPMLEKISPTAQTNRLVMLRKAVDILAECPHLAIYLDAGHSHWHPASLMAERLKQAGIEKVRGFSLNVSNFRPNQELVAYGNRLSALLGGKHFVIDTSRNGAGATDEWCNPPDRALGMLPSTDTANEMVDAFLWIKTPGESDGECNGGPPAGEWWPHYVLGLARRALWY